MNIIKPKSVTFLTNPVFYLCLYKNRLLTFDWMRSQHFCNHMTEHNFRFLKFFWGDLKFHPIPNFYPFNCISIITSSNRQDRSNHFSQFAESIFFYRDLFLRSDIVFYNKQLITKTVTKITHNRRCRRDYVRHFW